MKDLNTYQDKGKGLSIKGLFRAEETNCYEPGITFRAKYVRGTGSCGGHYSIRIMVIRLQVVMGVGWISLSGLHLIGNWQTTDCRGFSWRTCN